MGLGFMMTGCQSTDSDLGSDDQPFVTRSIPAEPQRSGDAMAGYHTLVNYPYISCGVPYSLFATLFGTTRPEDKLPGRDGKNADLPYYMTWFRAPSGVELVTSNCLLCHASRINGSLVVGLGDAASDFTSDSAAAADAAGLFIKDPLEKTEWERWRNRIDTIAPFTQATTMGVNVADNLTAAILTHRDRKTLAWSDKPLLDPPAAEVIPVDVPPWWRMSKKNAMFYNASGRGDHARIMMTASTLCTDNVAEAATIDALFPDVRTYISTLPPPVYPFPVDQTVAARGKDVFNRTCSRCHGTYGEGGSYPNLLVALTEVGTDDTLASSAQFAGRYVDWFNQSFYGQISRIEPQRGYVAPPLDGIWATAPFLHNGSVPTVAALLNSSLRPRFFTRTFDSSDYDQVALGWHYTDAAHSQSEEPSDSKRVRIYDTTAPGYSNRGHLYGDALTEAERSSVIEYLKTL